MSTNVPMPKLGLTMEEARIIEWLVPDGQHVEADEPILLIETDKTETEVGSPGSGVLHQLGHADAIFACGEQIAVLLAEGEAPPAPPVPAAPGPEPGAAAGPVPGAPASRLVPASSQSSFAPVANHSGRLLVSPNARRVAAEKGITLASVRGTGPGGRIVSEDLTGAASVVRSPLVTLPLPARGQAVATAAARQLADLLGIDISQVRPDQREQRVTRDGVALHVRSLLQAQSEPAPTAENVEPAETASLLQEPSELIRLSGMRGTIAKRMTASLQQMAQLTLTMDADMSAVLADRAQRKAAASGDGELVVPSITDYIVAASARALLQHPRMNAQVSDQHIAVLPEVHVGLAVAVDNGLMVPVVTNTAERDLADLAAQTSELAAAVRDGSVSPDQLSGGTFSVSALGALGVDVFTPVINPPNAGILGVGRLRDELIVEDGQVTSVKKLTLSLTWDHRVLDGVPAAEFCRTIVTLLSNPAVLS